MSFKCSLWPLLSLAAETQYVGYFIPDKIQLLNMPSHPQPLPSLLFKPSPCFQISSLNLSFTKFLQLFIYFLLLYNACVKSLLKWSNRVTYEWYEYEKKINKWRELFYFFSIINLLLFLFKMSSHSSFTLLFVIIVNSKFRWYLQKEMRS